MNFIIFICLLAIIVLLYVIFVRASELVNLMSVLVSLVQPKSVEYDENQAAELAEKNQSDPEAQK